jgi:two-component system, LytTR family, response regulator
MSPHDGALTVLIVDDERPARRKLRRLLEGAEGVGRVVEAADGRLALEVVEATSPDVVFLDVRMPGLDGFEFLDALGERGDTEVVFVTAYDEHALRAFDVRAIDYLLKPYDEARFRQALDRARAAVTARRDSKNATTEGRATAGLLVAALKSLEAGGGTRLPSSPAAGAATDADSVAAGAGAVAGTGAVTGSGAGRGAQRLLVEAASGRKVPLATSQVVRVQAERNDAVLLTADGARYRLRATLTELATRLGTERFWRISRSEIVNLDFVSEIDVLDHGDAHIHMQGGDVRRMSRRYRDGLERLG